MMCRSSQGQQQTGSEKRAPLKKEAHHRAGTIALVYPTRRETTRAEGSESFEKSFQTPQQHDAHLA